MDDELRGEEIDVDRAVAIRPPRMNAATSQRFENARMRMSEQVVQSARDERDTRMDGVEQKRRRRRLATVVSDLQHVRANVARRQQLLGVTFDVAGQQRR